MPSRRAITSEASGEQAARGELGDALVAATRDVYKDGDAQVAAPEQGHERRHLGEPPDRGDRDVRTVAARITYEVRSREEARHGAPAQQGRRDQTGGLDQSVSKR